MAIGMDKAKLIHHANDKGKPACGAALLGDYPDWNVRTNPDRVTCPKCLKMLPDASDE